ncbi:MAG: DUF4145 domain-containing protein [Pedobacter sp.]|jgi:hypothetical protein
MRQNWTCPFCKHPSTIGDHDIDDVRGENYVRSVDGYKSVMGRFIVCPNPACKKITFTLGLLEVRLSESGRRIQTENITHFWHLIPDSEAKIYPKDIVPSAIIEDYEESCKIKEDSPKASATLSRRALQGMIRDFWGVKKPQDYKGLWTLKNEIEAIKDLVDPDVWAAIDAVREVGNIGAHMELDVNVIIDVEPEEATKLIGLIELLIEEWYINRYERKQRLTEIKKIADDKKVLKVAIK